MDFLMGIKGPDFVVVASDTAAVQQIITIKHDEDKIVAIDSHKVMGISGEPGDRVKFSDYIIANVKLNAFRNGVRCWGWVYLTTFQAHMSVLIHSLSTPAVANFARSEMATALRRAPYYANVLIAGYDEGKGPSLYWMDYLATMHRLVLCNAWTHCASPRSPQPQRWWHWIRVVLWPLHDGQAVAQQLDAG